MNDISVRTLGGVHSTIALTTRVGRHAWVRYLIVPWCLDILSTTWYCTTPGTNRVWHLLRRSQSASPITYYLTRLAGWPQRRAIIVVFGIREWPPLLSLPNANTKITAFKLILFAEALLELVVPDRWSCCPDIATWAARVSFYADVWLFIRCITLSPKSLNRKTHVFNNNTTVVDSSQSLITLALKCLNGKLHVLNNNTIVADLSKSL